MSKPQSETRVATPVSAATFRDKAFKSRVLILPDGRPVPVEDFTVTTGDPAVIEFLEKHADFTRQASAPQPE
ncbi:MAG: hypothetical protein HYZ18_00840 [Pseudogulbenkiania sp.]|nr:hypothetical protein [Pseudogulbenkiania sp.]